MSTLIIPDVHGETFWEKPVLEAVEDSKVKQIIFLGDYFDSYYPERISRQDEIFNFIKILEVKKMYPDKVKLLMGNHDMAYMCCTGCSRQAWGDQFEYIRNLILENAKYMDVTAYSYKRDTLISHAGVTSVWLEVFAKKFFRENTGAAMGAIKGGFLNYMLHQAALFPESKFMCRFTELMSMVSFLRGGPDIAGSPMWADMREWGQEGEHAIPNLTQIVGHSKNYHTVDIIGQDRLLVKCVDLVDCQPYYIEDDEDFKRKEAKLS